jgi:hypothetical protein
MADLWYYTSEGRQMEPVSTAEIQHLARQGLLKPTDMVWREGMPSWVRANATPEIFADPNAALDRAFAGRAARPAPSNPAALDEPILLQPEEAPGAGPAGRHLLTDEPRRKKHPADHDREEHRDVMRRRKGRERHTWLIVLLGLLIGGGVLLVVMVLGMFYIAFAAR